MRIQLKLVGFFRETHPFLIRGQRQTLVPTENASLAGLL